MWESTFGRLPVASETALKHARPAKQLASSDPPRLLVPPPPNTPRSSARKPAAGPHSEARTLPANASAVPAAPEGPSLSPFPRYPHWDMHRALEGRLPHAPGGAMSFF